MKWEMEDITQQGTL